MTPSAGFRHQLEQVFGQVDEAVLIVDIHHVVVFANGALRKLLGSSLDPIGRKVESIFHAAVFLEFIQARWAGEGAEAMILQAGDSSRECWLGLNGSVLLSGNEREEGFLLLFVRDITQQKRLERLRTEFLANISHELRTPVTVMKGFADALVEDDERIDRKERLRFLNKIRKNGDRLHSMLEELLTLTRLETDPESVRLERTSLNRIVLAAAENFQMRLTEGQILSVNVSEEDCALLIDSLRISQVVENLLENVLRHAAGFTRIEVSTAVEEGGVVCRVTDNGPGIAERDLPHLFERFYRVDRGRSRESGGSGLGLSIVKHIVQQHGGDVRARSRVGEGTEMSFKIPFPEGMREKAALRFARPESVRNRGDEI